MQKFSGLEIKPYSQLTELPRVRIDRVRVEVQRTLFGETEYHLVGTMGDEGKAYPICAPFTELPDVWERKKKVRKRHFKRGRRNNMREKEKTRVIWRHPRGRFEVQESEHYSLFDHCTYYTRECVFTPQDDARGLCSEVPTGIFVPELCTPQKGVQGPVSDADVDQWCEWYKAGKNVADIAEMQARRSKILLRRVCARARLLPDPVPRVTDEKYAKWRGCLLPVSVR